MYATSKQTYSSRFCTWQILLAELLFFLFFKPFAVCAFDELLVLEWPVPGFVVHAISINTVEETAPLLFCTLSNRWVQVSCCWWESRRAECGVLFFVRNLELQLPPDDTFGGYTVRLKSSVQSTAFETPVQKRVVR